MALPVSESFSSLVSCNYPSVSELTSDMIGPTSESEERPGYVRTVEQFDDMNPNDLQNQDSSEKNFCIQKYPKNLDYLDSTISNLSDVHNSCQFQFSDHSIDSIDSRKVPTLLMKEELSHALKDPPDSLDSLDFSADESPVRMIPFERRSRTATPLFEPGAKVTAAVRAAASEYWDRNQKEMRENELNNGMESENECVYESNNRRESIFSEISKESKKKPIAWIWKLFYICELLCLPILYILSVVFFWLKYIYSSSIRTVMTDALRLLKWVKKIVSQMKNDLVNCVWSRVMYSSQQLQKADDFKLTSEYLGLFTEPPLSRSDSFSSLASYNTAVTYDSLNSVPEDLYPAYSKLPTSNPESEPPKPKFVKRKVWTLCRLLDYLKSVLLCTKEKEL